MSKGIFMDIYNLSINCQLLYDLRSLTGFCSGQELSELFTRLGLGPSPCGSAKVDLDEALRARDSNEGKEDVSYPYSS